MHADDLVTDDGRNRKADEDTAIRHPKFDAVAPLALVVEAIHPAYGWRLMVPSERKEAVRILDLVREDKAGSLEAALAAVHTVAEEDVIGQRRIAAMFEDPQQVVVLAVHVDA